MVSSLAKKEKIEMTLPFKNIDQEKISKILKDIEENCTEEEAIYLISLLYHALPDKYKKAIQIADDLYHQEKIFGVKVE